MASSIRAHVDEFEIQLPDSVVSSIRAHVDRSLPTKLGTKKCAKMIIICPNDLYMTKSVFALISLLITGLGGVYSLVRNSMTQRDYFQCTSTNSSLEDETNDERKHVKDSIKAAKDDVISKLPKYCDQSLVVHSGDFCAM